MRETKLTTVSLIHNSRVRTPYSYTLDPGTRRTGPFRRSCTKALRMSPTTVTERGRGDPQYVPFFFVAH